MTIQQFLSVHYLVNPWTHNTMSIVRKHVSSVGHLHSNTTITMNNYLPKTLNSRLEEKIFLRTIFFFILEENPNQKLCYFTGRVAFKNFRLFSNSMTAFISLSRPVKEDFQLGTWFLGVRAPLELEHVKNKHKVCA